MRIRTFYVRIYRMRKVCHYGVCVWGMIPRTLFKF